MIGARTRRTGPRSSAIPASHSRVSRWISGRRYGRGSGRTAASGTTATAQCIGERLLFLAAQAAQGRDLASDGNCATGRLCCVDPPSRHSLVTLLRRGTVATAEGGSAGTGDQNRLESAVGLNRKCRLDCTRLRTHLSSAHPEQVRGLHQLSVDEASVRGV
jgi:hypothetical protein